MTKSPNKKFIKLPLILGTAIFSLSMIVLWVVQTNELNKSMMIVGGGYAILCFAFLVFQIAAFVRSHVVYDEDVESIKLKVFQVERDDEI
jgi:hypothetical protein